MEIRQCEICGQVFIASYGYSLVLNWLVTGSAHVRAFLCDDAGPSGQHWGCTAEHAMMAAEKCLKEHMHIGTLQDKHEQTEKPRYSDQDSVWAESRGENFHHIEIVGGPFMFNKKENNNGNEHD